MRKNLVVVRAGDSSLHEAWLAGPEARNWDLVVNYFGDDPDRYHTEDVRRIDSKGPKWPALHALMQEYAEDFGRYDRVWLPDDDLACTTASINLFFDIFAQTELELAQPSLSFDSYISHAITLNNSAFILRFTSFVEIMAPCFSRNFLTRCIPSFGSNASGWGLDLLWPTWIADPSKIAIVDAVAIRHTRPVGGPNYTALKAKNISPMDEMAALFQRENLTSFPIVIKGAIDRETRTLSAWNGGHIDLVKGIISGYLPGLSEHGGVIAGMVADTLALVGTPSP